MENDGYLDELAWQIMVFVLVGLAAAIVWPGIVEYVSTGHVEMHWSRPALASLGGTISESTMREMNYAVDGEGRDLSEVARRFLEDNGLR